MHEDLELVVSFKTIPSSSKIKWSLKDIAFFVSPSSEDQWVT
jgi:hypothetical protein